MLTKSAVCSKIHSNCCDRQEYPGLRISERERLVRAPVRRWGRSALSTGDEGFYSCVVPAGDSRYRIHECRNRRNSGGTAVNYRPEAMASGRFHFFRRMFLCESFQKPMIPKR